MCYVQVINWQNKLNNSNILVSGDVFNVKSKMYSFIWILGSLKNETMEVKKWSKILNEFYEMI